MVCEGASRVRSVTTRSLVILLTPALFAIAATGCSTHEVAVSRPCATVTRGGKAVAIENRGAIAMAKVGLTPAGLKAQEKCR